MPKVVLVVLEASLDVEYGSRAGEFLVVELEHFEVDLVERVGLEQVVENERVGFEGPPAHLVTGSDDHRQVGVAVAELGVVTDHEPDRFIRLDADYQESCGAPLATGPGGSLRDRAWCRGTASGSGSPAWLQLHEEAVVALLDSSEAHMVPGEYRDGVGSPRWRYRQTGCGAKPRSPLLASRWPSITVTRPSHATGSAHRDHRRIRGRPCRLRQPCSRGPP